MSDLLHRWSPSRFADELNRGLFGKPPSDLVKARNTARLSPMTVLNILKRRSLDATRRLALALIVTSAAAAAQAEEWPQFRGPTGQGHSAEGKVPVEWSETRNV